MYKSRTVHFGIPSVGEGQQRSATEEFKARQILENQILGLMRHFTNDEGMKILSRGTLSISEDKETEKVYLTMRAMPSFEGIVSDTYVYRMEPLIWEVERGQTQFCGLRKTEETPLYPNKVELVVSSTQTRNILWLVKVSPNEQAELGLLYQQVD